MLGVIGALEEEVELLRAGMVVSNVVTHAEISVTRGEFRGVEIAVARCGVGSVNAATCTQMLIDLHQPDALIFSGVAGGLLANMRGGDLIIASHLVQYDMDLAAFGRRPGELSGKGRMIECDQGLVQKATEAFDVDFSGAARGPNLTLGIVASGDRFVQDQKTLRWLRREFSALATEMEGASFGYTCQRNEIPFVVLRGLSDRADENAKGDFGANLKTVCQLSFRLLERLIPGLSE